MTPIGKVLRNGEDLILAKKGEIKRVNGFKSLQCLQILCSKYLKTEVIILLFFDMSLC